MCGIVGCLLCDKNEAVNQVLYDGLTMVQVSGADTKASQTS